MKLETVPLVAARPKEFNTLPPKAARPTELDAVPLAAARQGGVFTMAQALSEGWTTRQIRRRMAAGRWRYVAGWALARAVPSGPPPVWTAFQLAVAAQLTIPSLVSSHWTAGLIHGFPIAEDDDSHLVPTNSHGGSSRSHVISPGWRESSRGLVVHCLRLDSDEIASHASTFRITSKYRTALDLLSNMSMPAALDLWAWVSSRQILDLGALEAAIDQRRRWHGRPQLQQLLALVHGGAVSAAEFVLHQLLREAGIEGWAAGVTLTDHDGVIGVVDVHFDGTRLVIEVDGFRAHSTKLSFMNDRRRQNRLIMAGYTVLRYTWDDLQNRATAVLAEIRTAVLLGANPAYPGS